MIDYGKPTSTWIERRWPAIRAKGMAHFILVRGLLFWGGVLFALSVIMVWVKFGPQHPRFVLLLCVAALICSVGGLVWGGLTWAINERLFRNRDSNRRPP